MPSKNVNLTLSDDALTVIKYALGQLILELGESDKPNIALQENVEGLYHQVDSILNDIH